MGRKAKAQSTSMHVEAIRRNKGGRVYTYYYLRHTYREGDKVKHKAVANLSALPLPIIELIRAGLRGEPIAAGHENIRCVRSRSHGAVWAVATVMRKLDFPRLFGAQPQKWHRIVQGMIATRILDAGSKLFATRWWDATTLAEDWQLPVDLLDEKPTAHGAANKLYAALDAMLVRQDAIQKKLAERHLRQGALVLFDLSSSYVEGRHCPLAKFGHNRDGKKGKMQITYGLLTNQQGCPVAIEVFAGNQSDPMALKPQIDRLRNEFGFSDLVVVGDRGMITKTRIPDLEKAGLDWLTALKAPDIQQLHQQGLIQLSLFDQRDLIELHDPEHPTRRLVACRNPLLAEERARKRTELLAATEQDLAKIAARVHSGRTKLAKDIALAVGKVINKRKMQKHFRITIDDGQFAYQRDEASVQGEAILDGIYVMTTNVSEDILSNQQVLASYKSLRNVEQAFRTMKTTLLELRPIFHRLEDRVRAHAFLCMLAYYVVWHMRQALAPLLTEAEGFDSLQAILVRLSTIQRQTMDVHGHQFHLVTEPDPLQRHIFELLDVPIPA